jgi:hypothetical protein
MVKLAKPMDGDNTNRQVLNDYFRLKRQKPKLGKAIDQPIGQSERAREDQPIGWDMGPDGPRIFPKSVDEGEAQGLESPSDVPVAPGEGPDAPIRGKADNAPGAAAGEPEVEHPLLGGGGAVFGPRAPASIGDAGQGLGAPFYSPARDAPGKET